MEKGKSAVGRVVAAVGVAVQRTNAMAVLPAPVVLLKSAREPVGCVEGASSVIKKRQRANSRVVDSFTCILVPRC